jgi:hypothetical protein
MNEQELVQLFKRLGASNPAAWAHSQASEGIPQLARYLFLREAWNLVVSDSDASWMSECCKITANVPGGAIGPAINRLMSGAFSPEDLTIVVRVMQWRLLSGLCLLLDGPSALEPELDNIAWHLFQVDENNCPITPISGLIESVLETDPTGREMRPA